MKQTSSGSTFSICKEITMKKALFLCTVFALIIGLGSAAYAATDYPTKPVTMIIPYRAGGSTDTMGRVLAKALKEELGKPVIVVNRKGGGGSVGTTYLKNAEPDGYTFLMGGEDAPVLNPILQEVEFTWKDFCYLAAVTEYQNALVTLSEQPYSTLQELIAYSKEHPGITYASQSPIDIAITKRIMEQEGLDWKIVTTTGGGEAMQFLFGKKIDVSYSGGVHGQYPEKLKVLASYNKNCLAASPDKPSVVELGYGLSVPSYVVFMAPAGVPDEIAKKLENAILKASQDKDFQTIVKDRLQFPIISVTSEELEERIAEMADSFKDLKK